MGAVVALDQVRPKQMRRTYKKHPIEVTYTPGNPKESRWQWKVTFTTVTVFTGSAASSNAAIKGAEKYIDSVSK
jgi:hypothetical protein